jgi:hypothetical protein
MAAAKGGKMKTPAKPTTAEKPPLENAPSKKAGMKSGKVRGNLPARS